MKLSILTVHLLTISRFSFALICPYGIYRQSTDVTVPLSLTL